MKIHNGLLRRCTNCNDYFRDGHGFTCKECYTNNQMFKNDEFKVFWKYAKIWALPLTFLWLGGQFGADLHAGNASIPPVIGLAVGFIIGVGFLFIARSNNR